MGQADTDALLEAEARYAQQTEVRRAKEAPEGGGVWIAYHSDWSGFVPFQTEVDALRHAVDLHMSVVFVPWGTEPRDTVRAQYDRAGDDA